MKRIKTEIFRLLIERIFKDEIFKIYEEGASDGYKQGCNEGWYEAKTFNELKDLAENEFTYALDEAFENMCK